MVALLGAGAPLAQRTLTGEWVTPVVDTVLLPAHATTTTPQEEFLTGNFASTTIVIGDAPSSMFKNIVDRTEEEILDLFIRSAEAATTCEVTDCDADGTVEVEVVASFDSNPGVGCVQAKVSTALGGSCSFECVLYTFDAEINGESVQVDDSGCQLQLSSVTLTSAAGLSGFYSFADTGNTLTHQDNFSAPPGGRGCPSLTCDV